jgi:hypothetical protein
MPLALLASTGDADLDRSLEEVVGAYERAFPGAIRGYYLYGSNTDGTRGPLSDFDLGIVVPRTLTTARRWRSCAGASLVSRTSSSPRCATTCWTRSVRAIPPR